MRHRVLVGASAIAAGLFCAVAAGQVRDDVEPTIPDSIITAGRPLTAAEQDVVNKYLDYWVARLSGGEPQVVARARNKLTEPPKRGGKQYFKDYYDQALSGRLAGPADAKQTLVRINTMIIARDLKNARLVPVLTRGLADESAAVVYVAAQAAGRFLEDVAGGAGLSPAQKRPLEKPLVDALKAATSEWVVDVLYDAAVKVDTPAAWIGVLDKAEERLRDHRDAGASIIPELNAVQTLTNRVVSLWARQQPTAIPAAQLPALKRFAQVAFKYMDLCSQLVFNQQVAGGNNDPHMQMIKWSEYALRWIVDTPFNKVSGAGITLPASTTTQEGIAGVRLVVEDWRRLLQAEPFNFKPADLQLPSASPADAPATASDGRDAR